MVQRPATRAAAVAALLFPLFQPSLAQKSINPVCNTDALTALSALYINTNGPYWDGNGNNRGNWLTATDGSCFTALWNGMVATDDDSGVVSIDLSTKAKSDSGGVLPTQLGLLTQLTLFDWSSNSLYGNTAHPAQALRRAAAFSADRALTWATPLHPPPLSGTLPSQIGTMVALQELDLSDQVSGLTGTLPSELGLLTDLTLFKLCVRRRRRCRALLTHR